MATGRWSSATRRRVDAQRSTTRSRDWSARPTIAVPGKMTSAYLALQLYLGRVRTHRRAVRSNLRRGRRRTRRCRPHHSRRPAHLCAARVSARLSIWANGGSAKPACRCRSAAMFCAKIFRRKCGAICSQIMRESIDYGLAHRDEAVRHSHALRARHGCGAGRQIHRHVRERLHARLRRDGARGDPANFSASAAERGYHRRRVELEFVE